MQGKLYKDVTNLIISNLDYFMKIYDWRGYDKYKSSYAILYELDSQICYMKNFPIHIKIDNGAGDMIVFEFEMFNRPYEVVYKYLTTELY